MVDIYSSQTYINALMIIIIIIIFYRLIHAHAHNEHATQYRIKFNNCVVRSPSLFVCIITLSVKGWGQNMEQEIFCFFVVQLFVKCNKYLFYLIIQYKKNLSFVISFIFFVFHWFFIDCILLMNVLLTFNLSQHCNRQSIVVIGHGNIISCVLSIFPFILYVDECMLLIYIIN